MPRNIADGPVGTAPELISLVNAGALSQAIYVAAELKLADLLSAGPKRADELAQATSCHAPSLQRLLRALVAVGVCREDSNGSFLLEPLGSPLRSDAPNSVRSWVILWGKYQWPVWADLLLSIRTGESARKRATGKDGFSYLERDPNAAATFNGAMAELTRLVAGQLMDAYDFTRASRVVDVGGGYGTMLGAILQRHSKLHGVVFDLPHAIEGARTNMARMGLASRCEFVAGDFFLGVPSDADVYLLKAVIHDWDDEQSIAILRSCRSAMRDDATLLIIERILPETFQQSSLHRAIAKVDLSMLVEQGGRERTGAEFGALLGAAGLRTDRVVATELDYSIIECKPASAAH